MGTEGQQHRQVFQNLTLVRKGTAWPWARDLSVKGAMAKWRSPDQTWCKNVWLGGRMFTYFPRSTTFFSWRGKNPHHLLMDGRSRVEDLNLEMGWRAKVMEGDGSHQHDTFFLWSYLEIGGLLKSGAQQNLSRKP